MKGVICILSIVILLIGCNDEPTNLNTRTITISHVADSVDFDSLVEEYEYIELSQENRFIVGDIKQIIIDNDKIYVSAGGVFCYNLKGDPVFKIAAKGHAKSEFIDCTSISINEGILYLYDKKTGILHKYNSSNGAFLDNIVVPVACRSLFKINDLYILDKLYTSDFYDGNARILTTKDFNKCDGAYLDKEQYKMPFADQVTYCSQSVIFAHYKGTSFFRFGKYGCTEYNIQCKDVSSSPHARLYEDEKNDKYAYELTNVYENNSYITGSFQSGNCFTFLYNKKSHRAIAFKDFNSCSYRIGLTHARGVYKDYFVYVITQEHFDFLKEAFGFGTPLPQAHPDYRKQKTLLEHKTHGNPIIALYKHKRAS